ncbi:MAG TPA: hypothetical protein VJV78_11455 [Polyangiales bacterium]|nr:hypothetical protein [Polyangiales bacterium]
MKRPTTVLTCLAALSALAASGATAQQREKPAQVQLPLDTYDSLVERVRSPKTPERPAPARYALGTAVLNVEVTESGGAATAHAQLDLAVRVLEDGWVAVPLLPNGTAVRSATLDNRPVELVSTPAGLALSSEKAGSHQLRVEYDVDAQSSEHGRALALPLPEAPSTRMQAELPGSELDVAVIPASAVSSERSDDTTTVEATIPSGRGVQLSWRLPSDHGYSLNRARYRGVLVRDAVRFDAEIGFELFDGETVLVPLLPSDVILSALSIDGKPSAIAVQDEAFAARVRGRGQHRLQLAFELPVVRDDGPPHVDLRIPEVPVSELEISLPGGKEVTLDPVAHVEAIRKGGDTVSRAFLPLTSQVQISWAEAVPQEADEELLANANLFHLVHAEEGVLYVHAVVVYEVTSGHSNVIELEVPSNVQVSDIRAEAGGIKKAIKTQRDPRSTVEQYSVFLDRELQGELRFDVMYERKLGHDPLQVPLIRARGVSRQRGMLALLASKELTLNPDDASAQNVTRVGENQLPSFVREAVDKTVAHTYKYLEDEPKLVVSTAPPERKQGKFDAQVDTLISLGDVTLRGAASININVKSGSLEALALRLPKGVNFLGLTAPSLRTHSVKDAQGAQLIDVQFTQQMDGQFRLEVNYEKITSEAEADVAVPALRVEGAEVEQGRIAVEALSAVEVGEKRRDHLSPLDPSELPQQLVLKTTNPILRAYKYVQVEPALALAVTRHKEVDVQKATIDLARYQTLYTRDGLAVTTARFSVRNSREQFLKVRLPKGSKVWSVFVAERAEKPAIEEAKNGEPTVLIKIITSTDGFPVELVYETPAESIGSLGRISGRLPNPDMVVTHSTWDVYLPAELQYGEPSSNMEQRSAGSQASAADMKQALESSRQNAALAPLRIDVPTEGVRYAFSKLYANRASEPAEFSLPYSSQQGSWLARLLSLLGATLFCAGMFLLLRANARRAALASAGLGVVLVLVASSLGVSSTWPLLWSLILASGFGARWLIALRPRASNAAASGGVVP